MNATLYNFNNRSNDGAATTASLDMVTARWTRLGIMFNIAASTEDVVDLERLLLDTARMSARNTRLLVMAVTWLSRHGNAVAKHRVTRLVRFELEVEHRAALGLILDLARVADRRLNGTRFNAAIEACAEGLIVTGRPLSDVENQSAALRKLAESRASVESRRWGRWIESFDLKVDALRPAVWVMRHNPMLYEASLANGDLIASILAELASVGGHSASESTLAYACAASRPAIRAALATLERAGRVAIQPGSRSHSVRLLSSPALAA